MGISLTGAHASLNAADFITTTALSRIGVVDSEDTQVAFDDVMSGDVWTSANGGTGSAVRGAGVGTMLLSTGAGAGGVGGIFWGTNFGGGGFPFLLPGGASGRWYVEWRAKMTTAITANTLAGLYGAEVVAGVRGASSTTKWVAFFDAGSSPTLTSSINIDNGVYHRFRLWRDGSAGAFFQVDNEANVVSAGAHLSGNMRLGSLVDNGADAVNRALEVDYMFCLSVRNA